MKDNDSDNDQGFVPTKVEIKADHKLKNVHKVEYLSDRPVDFQGRYIFGDGLLRKQPLQVYARFSQYLPEYSSDSPKPLETQIKQEQQSNLTKTIIINLSQTNGKLLSDSKNPSQKYSKFIADSIQQPIAQYKTMEPSHHKVNSASDMTGHPYQKFIQNQNYTLVYSRYKDRIQTITPQSDDFSDHQINLTKVLTKYDPDHYSVLKAFQFIPIGRLKDKIHKQERIIYHVNHPSQSKTRNHPVHDINETYTNRQNSNNPSFQVHLQPNHSHSHIIPPSSQNNSHTNNSFSSHNSHLGHQNSELQHQIEDLQFDSKFQCGNLLYAFKNKSEGNHYILFLQNDTNSYGYNQWFYFSLRNMKSKVLYRFTIVNLRKRHSLFKQGMKISVFSLIDAQNNSEKGDGCGWRKTGKNIKYQRSVIKKHSDKKYKFYSLSFELEFPHDGDYVKVSMNIPYSYSRLIHHLKICNQIVRKGNQSEENMQKQKYKKTPRKMSNKYKSLHSKQFLDNGSRVKQMKQKGLQWEMVPVGYSISNNAVPYITICSNKKQPKSQGNIIQNPSSIPEQQSNVKTKKAIVFLARQHPGQTWSSFMMQQILYALAQCKSESIRWLLQNYTIKIFPMINVDGVIYGNFRCDLGGFDLNRNWRNPDKNLHPQIYAIKAQMQKINTQYKIQCVLDLHGHSKQYNTFSYACKNDTLTARVLSLLISEINPIFHFPFCTFGLSRYKQTTARAYLYRLTGSQNILTIQNSFYGAKVGQKLIVYDPEILRQLSLSILQGLQEYLSVSIHRNNCEVKVQKNIQQYLQFERKAEAPTLVDSGSESQPYADQISIKDKIKKILPKSFKAIESQLEQQEKIIKKKHTIKKKDEKKQIKIVKQYKTVNPSALRKTRQGNKQTESEQVDQTFIQRNSLTYYKKNSKQIPKKQIPSQPANSQQTTRFARLSIEEDKTVVKSDFAGKVGDVGLPFYIRQKSTLVPIKLKNDSLEIFKDAYNATSKNNQSQNNMNLTMMRPSHKKVKIINSIHNQATQQFPILCVLSEQKKKQSQLQKTHAMLNQRREKGTTSLPPKVRTFVQNQKLESLKRHNKQKNASYIQSTNHNHNQAQAATSDLKQVRQFKSKTKDANLISKIWRQNFARYGKDLNVFFGGIKG